MRSLIAQMPGAKYAFVIRSRKEILSLPSWVNVKVFIAYIAPNRHTSYILRTETDLQAQTDPNTNSLFLIDSSFASKSLPRATKLNATEPIMTDLSRHLTDAQEFKAFRIIYDVPSEAQQALPPLHSRDNWITPTEYLHGVNE